MSNQPLMYDWDGEVMRPASRYWARQADETFVVGMRYRMVEEEGHSIQSHKHEFAFLKQAWNSFPDELLEQFPSPEHLRKFGLIRKGYSLTKQYACKSAAEATRFAAGLRDNVDTYKLITINGPIVTVSTAESQSFKAMGKARFQASKEALMEYVGSLIGVSAETLADVQEAA